MTKYQNINFHEVPEEEEAISKKFHEMLSDFLNALEDEAWLGKESWDPAFDFHEDIEVSWQAVAEAAAEIEALRPTFRTLPLQRMAGLILRAVEAESSERLAAVLDRSLRCLDMLGSQHSEMCRDLVHDAHDTLDQMVSAATTQRVRDMSAAASSASGRRFAA